MMSPRTVDDFARELAGLPPAMLHKRLRASLDRLSLRERFELLHRLKIYHHPESVSGAASTFRETAALRAALPRLVAARGIGSILDIPCGDFHWLRHVTLGVSYTGADIVREIVTANQQRYSCPTRQFLVLDATHDPLPTVDIILCRDLLIHLDLQDCRAALRNFAASRSRFLLVSHFGARTADPDIVSGDFRPINLCRPPFRLPPPLEVISEESELGDGAFRDRALGLWSLPDIAAHLTAPG
jgi:hypothetical protein